MSALYFNEESGYSEKKTCYIKSSAPPFFNHFSFSMNKEETFGNESYEKETKHIHTPAESLLDIRIGNLDWCKCGRYENKAIETDYFCYREVDATLITSTKIREREGSISLSSFY